MIEVIDALIWLGVPVLVGLGVAIGRISVTAEQRIARVRIERQRWRLFLWQREIEEQEGHCVRCRTTF